MKKLEYIYLLRLQHCLLVEGCRLSHVPRLENFPPVNSYVSWALLIFQLFSTKIFSWKQNIEEIVRERAFLTFPPRKYCHYCYVSSNLSSIIEGTNNRTEYSLETTMWLSFFISSNSTVHFFFGKKEFLKHEENLLCIEIIFILPSTCMWKIQNIFMTKS